MTNEELLSLILGDSARIAAALESGPGWTLWMQVELAVLLSGAGLQVAREVPYSPPLDLLRLDILATDPQGGSYAIQLKCQEGSPNGPEEGRGILEALQSAMAEIKSFSLGSLGDRWVVGIAYSTPAKNELAEYAARYPGVVITGQSNVIAVIVIDANAL